MCIVGHPNLEFCFTIIKNPTNLVVKVNCSVFQIGNKTIVILRITNTQTLLLKYTAVFSELATTLLLLSNPSLQPPYLNVCSHIGCVSGRGWGKHDPLLHHHHHRGPSLQEGIVSVKDPVCWVDALWQLKDLGNIRLV